jgi:hypothetical protein
VRQHRIYLVSGSPAVTGSRMLLHWTERHAGLFLHTPQLRGYAQNRPLAEELDRVGPLACSETWFADRTTERSAFSSPYYRQVVAADEASFLNRDALWSSAVVRSTPWPRHSLPYRVLMFGPRNPARLPGDGLETAKTVPRPGSGRWIESVWTHSRGDALVLAAAAECFAVATEPANYSIPMATERP